MNTAKIKAPNSAKEPTTIDQVVALAIRIYKFLRRKIGEFDGITFQDAIALKHHPFWTKLEEAVKTLHLPFNFFQSDLYAPICIGDGRTPRQIMEALIPGWQSNIYNKEEVLEIAGLPGEELDGSVDIVFLYPSHEIPYEQVLEEFKKRGWENAHPLDALRILERNPLLYFIKIGKYNHNIVFINEKTHEASLELGYDAMNISFLCKTDKKKHACYAARRKRQ